MSCNRTVDESWEKLWGHCMLILKEKVKASLHLVYSESLHTHACTQTHAQSPTRTQSTTHTHNQIWHRKHKHDSTHRYSLNTRKSCLKQNQETEK